MSGNPYEDGWRDNCEGRAMLHPDCDDYAAGWRGSAHATETLMRSVKGAEDGMENLSLVMHFNHFTGQLQSGYLMHKSTKKKASHWMSAGQVIAHLAAHPTMRCEPLRV